MELYERTAHELHDLLKRGEISCVELTRAVLERISHVEGKIDALVTVTGERALKQAEEAEARFRRGEDVSPLTGIPIVIKDNICTKGIPTTCSSKILGGFVPPYDATIAERLNRAGAVTVAKGNMDEFAMGSSTENSGIKPTRNPWALDRVPGGSSGGPAAAVSAGECTIGIGSDTGGSVRQPAALCGIVGLKPTYGRVSRYGLVAFASSLDQIGPLTRDVTDCALTMNVIGGYDERDSTSINIPLPDYTGALVNDVRGVKIGIPDEFFIEGMDPDVERAVEDAIELLKRLGARAVKISLPHTSYAVMVYYIIAPAEASSNLARFDGVQYGHRARNAADLKDMYGKTKDEGFGPEVKRRIMLGTYVLSSGYYEAFYSKAQKVRTLIRKDFIEAFKEVDCILTPTSPTPAFKIGEKVSDPLRMYLSDIFTISAPLAGIPAISIPCGFSGEGLPIGLQFMGPALGEEIVFRVAYTFEQNTDYHLRRPRL
ncbi:MAG: Asp-tRNA(Asn)/Glu-tRNA(Gln) amidotransferase subunit GatA [bacterium]